MCRTLGVDDGPEFGGLSRIKRSSTSGRLQRIPNFTP
jgi:hypothetical protein